MGENLSMRFSYRMVLSTIVKVDEMMLGLVSKIPM